MRETRVMLELGEFASATAYVRGQRVRTVVQRGLRQAFDDNGLAAVVAPTLPLTTHASGHSLGGSHRER